MFHSSMVAIQKIKTTLALSKQAHVKICIIVLSKVPMYLFHRDYIKNKYGNTSRLLLRDTDSFMYEIETKNVYEDFSKSKVTF